jgi:hypothetical protein
MAKVEQRLFTTLDIYLAAFLSLNRIPPTLELRNGRVVFTFSATDDLYKLTMNFNSNVNVPVADFVTIIKTLRGLMPISPRQNYYRRPSYPPWTDLTRRTGWGR